MVTRQTCMRLPHHRCAIVAYTHCAYLARSYRLRQNIHKRVHFEERRGEMDLIEVDALDAQTLQTVIQCPEQGMSRRTCARKTCERWRKFAGNDDRTTIFPTACAQKTLRFTIPIHFSRIKEVEASIQTGTIRLGYIITCVRLTIAPDAFIAPTPYTNTQSRDNQF